MTTQPEGQTPDDPVCGLAEHWATEDYAAPAEVTTALAKGILRLQRENADLRQQLAAAEARTVDPDEIIAALIKDIRSRKGIGDEWENIDVDIRNEIAGEWRNIIRALLKGKSNESN
jgi:hypothetical protein